MACMMNRATCARTSVSRPIVKSFTARVPGASRIARQRLQPVASLTVKESVTGVEFPLAQKFWEGEMFRCLGAGSRLKKILLLSVKVYAVGLYVEADKAARELGIRQRGGFFQSDDDYCQALLDGAFNKALIIHLVRDVDGPTFADAINKNLAPRMNLMGQTAQLNEFVNFFSDKNLTNNTEVALFWNATAGDLEVCITPNVTGVSSYQSSQPGLRIRSPGMCRALFEIFAGSESVVMEARGAWVKGAKELLDSENVKRGIGKGGSG